MRAAEVFSAGSRTIADYVALSDRFWAGQRIPPLSTKVGMKTDGGGMRISCSFPCPVHGLRGYGSSGNRAESNEKRASHPQYLEWPGFGVHVPSCLPGKAGGGIRVARRTVLPETQPSLAAQRSLLLCIILGFHNLEQLCRLVQSFHLTAPRLGSVKSRLQTAWSPTLVQKRPFGKR